MVFGYDPADSFGRGGGGGGGNDEDRLLAQDASPLGQFGRQWKLRVMAQDAALNGMAKSKLRRLMAQARSFNCADAAVGHSAVNCKSASRRRGPAAILDIEVLRSRGETDVATSSESKNFKVARFCVRRQIDSKDVGEVNWKPASGTWDTLGGAPSVALGKTIGNEQPTRMGEGVASR